MGWLFAIIGTVIGAVLGFVIHRFIVADKVNRSRESAERMLADAEKQAETTRKEMLLEAKDEIFHLKAQTDEEMKERRKELTALESRIMQREESIERRAESLDKRDHQLASQAGQVAKREKELEDAIAEENARLESLAGMSSDQAKAVLLERVKQDVSHDAAVIIRETEQRAREEADRKARNIIGIAIGRVAADHTAESTVSVVHIPSDDLKGRIIGREGRNIRAFEQLTGINLIIDDTPEAVILSSFDPVRREVGRITLENLIADGRIHPARIEEMVEKARKEVEATIKQEGDRAVFETGIIGLHPEIIKLLGKLRYRTSYGQNVLQHSIEVCWLAGMMAAELGLDVAMAKRAGLLHDLGKAADFEMEGSHITLGAEIAKKYKEGPEVINAIMSHHGDVEPDSLISVLIAASDAISAARPGARRENLETYIKRIQKLEDIANSFEGVEKSYAIQAGREIRVMVRPENVKDDDMILKAREICRKIEDELDYPGQIKVHIIRETRVTEFAK